MNILNKFSIITFIISSGMSLFAQNGTEINFTAPHGGQIRQSDQYYIEFLFSTVNSYVYLYDQKAHPVSNVDVSGKLIFKQYDSTITAVILKQLVDYGFTADTNIPMYSICTVALMVKGKNLSVDFDYQESVAEQKK